MELQAAEGAVQVSDGNVAVRVSLTSAVMREPAGERGGGSGARGGGSTETQNKLSIVTSDLCYIVYMMLSLKIICSKMLC